MDRVEMMRERLTTALAPTQLEIIDESHRHAGHAGAQSGAGHFIVRISSPLFKNKSRVECHRKVYEALGDAMHTHIHALSIIVL